MGARSLVSLLSLGCLAACTVSTGGDGSRRTPPDAAPGPAAPDGAAPDASPSPGSDGGVPGGDVRILGTFALVTRVATLQTLGDMEPFPATGRFFGFATVSQRDGQLRFVERYCRATLDLGGAVQVGISDRWIQSQPTQDANLEIRKAPDGSTTYVLPQRVYPVGARLADPAGEALPQRADDPRVWDQDDDGHPGVTATVEGIGDMYVVRRERYTYGFGFVDDDHLEGWIRDTSEQRVVGASVPFLDVPSVEEPDPDASRSTVGLVRTDLSLEGVQDCPRLIAALDRLFPGDVNSR